jgi:uncharacterized membrane protein
MTRKQAVFAGFIIVLISVGLAVWAYPSLPERVPIHWDASGHADRFSTKLVGVSIMPKATVAVWLLLCLLMWVVPAISPKGFRIDDFSKVYYLINVAMLATLLLSQIRVLQSMGSGHLSSPWRFTILVAGIAVAIFGNFMGKFRKNFFIGIRTPWTLSSDEVWLRTHRLAGLLWTVGGVVAIALSFLRGGTIAAAAILVVVVVTPAVYSYFLYRRLEGFGADTA